jgi:AcrR family transcriptional regulator
MRDTKDIILKTAYNMFLSNNYEAVTINSIMKATDLTKGAIYHYFGSKEDIFKAVVDRYMIENKDSISFEYHSLKDFIQSSISFAKEKITTLVIDSPNFSHEIPLNHLSMIVAAYRYYPNFVRIGNVFMKEQKEKWVTILNKAMKSEEIRSNIDLDATVANFMVIGSGIVSNMMVGGSVKYAINMFERQYWEMYNNIKK